MVELSPAPLSQPAPHGPMPHTIARPPLVVGRAPACGCELSAGRRPPYSSG
jgi:hypothetical protein